MYTYRGSYLNALAEVIETSMNSSSVYLWTLWYEEWNNLLQAEQACLFARQGQGNMVADRVRVVDVEMREVKHTFSLDETRSLTTPRTHTPAGWITTGFSEDLYVASMFALEVMLNLMGQLYALSQRDAMALASLSVDLHIT
jgi:hypothetical protein